MTVSRKSKPIKPDLTQAELKELLHYNPETGDFTRLRCKRVDHIGKIAGSINAQGYVAISIHNWPFLAHRLAWLYVHGIWPQNHTDHINGNKTDNRICNLRCATASQNGINRAFRKNNSFGIIGVEKCSRQWRARITIDRKQIELGRFLTKSEAIAARRAAELRYFGEFAPRHSD